MEGLFPRLPEKLNNKNKVVVTELELILQTSASSEEDMGLQTEHS